MNEFSVQGQGLKWETSIRIRMINLDMTRHRMLYNREASSMHSKKQMCNRLSLLHQTKEMNLKIKLKRKLRKIKKCKKNRGVCEGSRVGAYNSTVKRISATGKLKSCSKAIIKLLVINNCTVYWLHHSSWYNTATWTFFAKIQSKIRNVTTYIAEQCSENSQQCKDAVD